MTQHACLDGSVREFPLDKHFEDLEVGDLFGNCYNPLNWVKLNNDRNHNCENLESGVVTQAILGSPDRFNHFP